MAAYRIRHSANVLLENPAVWCTINEHSRLLSVTAHPNVDSACPLLNVGHQVEEGHLYE